MNLLRPRTRRGRVGLWIVTCLLSIVALLGAGVGLLLGSEWAINTTRPCWDFDPAGYDIGWPVEADAVGTLDLTASDTSDVLRWVDAGCTEDTFDFLAFVLVMGVGLPGLILIPASLVVSPFIATQVMRRSRVMG